MGLGPGDPSQITLKAWDVLTAPGARVYVRTARHPTLEGLPSHVALTTFDHVYERTKLLEDVYPAIAAELLDIAELVAKTSVANVPGASASADDAFASFVLEDGDATVSVRKEQRQRRVVYAVPGDPCVAERSVQLLRGLAGERGVTVTIVPGVSFLEPTLAAIGVDVMPGLAIVDAVDVAAAGHAVGLSVDIPSLLCQVYSKQVASDVKLTLMQQYPEDHRVTLVHSAGCDDESVETVPLFEMDASQKIDILTSVFVPAVAGVNGAKGSVESVLDAIARARRGDSGFATRPGGGGPTSGGTGDYGRDDHREAFSPERGAREDDEREPEESSSYDASFLGDPGDAESVWLSLDHADGDAPGYLLREAGELACEAARSDDDAQVRKRTLGNALAAVCLHVAMASEAGEFTMRDVVYEAAQKVRETKESHRARAGNTSS